MELKILVQRVSNGYVVSHTVDGVFGAKVEVATTAAEVATTAAEVANLVLVWANEAERGAAKRRMSAPGQS